MVQLSRRLGVARLALQAVADGSSRQLSISTLQKTAAQELLTDAIASQRFTAEDHARLSDLILEIQSAPGHAEELLAHLAQTTDAKRRKQQDFRAATNYMIPNRWTAFLNPNSSLNDKADLIAKFGVEIDCINPTITYNSIGYFSV